MNRSFQGGRLAKRGCPVIFTPDLVAMPCRCQPARSGASFVLALFAFHPNKAVTGQRVAFGTGRPVGVPALHRSVSGGRADWPALFGFFQPPTGRAHLAYGKPGAGATEGAEISQTPFCNGPAAFCKGVKFISLKSEPRRYRLTSILAADAKNHVRVGTTYGRSQRLPLLSPLHRSG